MTLLHPVHLARLLMVRKLDVFHICRLGFFVHSLDTRIFPFVLARGVFFFLIDIYRRLARVCMILFCHSSGWGLLALLYVLGEVGGSIAFGFGIFGILLGVLGFIVFPLLQSSSIAELPRVWPAGRSRGRIS